MTQVHTNPVAGAQVSKPLDPKKLAESFAYIRDVIMSLPPTLQVNSALQRTDEANFWLQTALFMQENYEKQQAYAAEKAKQKAAQATYVAPKGDGNSDMNKSTDKKFEPIIVNPLKKDKS